MADSCSFFPMFCYYVSFSGVVSIKANTFVCGVCLSRCSVLPVVV